MKGKDWGLLALGSVALYALSRQGGVQGFLGGGGSGAGGLLGGLADTLKGLGGELTDAVKGVGGASFPTPDEEIGANAITLASGRVLPGGVADYRSVEVGSPEAEALFARFGGQVSTLTNFRYPDVEKSGVGVTVNTTDAETARVQANISALAAESQQRSIREFVSPDSPSGTNLSDVVGQGFGSTAYSRDAVVDFAGGLITEAQRDFLTTAGAW